MATLQILKCTYPDHLRSRLPFCQNSTSSFSCCLYNTFLIFSVFSALVCRNPSANLASDYCISDVPSLEERQGMLCHSVTCSSDSVLLGYQCTSQLPWLRIMWYSYWKFFPLGFHHPHGLILLWCPHSPSHCMILPVMTVSVSKAWSLEPVISLTLDVLGSKLILMAQPSLL